MLAKFPRRYFDHIMPGTAGIKLQNPNAESKLSHTGNYEQVFRRKVRRAEKSYVCIHYSPLADRNN